MDLTMFACTCACVYIYVVNFTNFFPSVFVSWMVITLQYCSGFCHTLTWIIMLHQIHMKRDMRPPDSWLSNILLGKNREIAPERMEWLGQRRKKTNKQTNKNKQNSVVDGSRGKSKVQCCKEQNCIGPWNVRLLWWLSW